MTETSDIRIFSPDVDESRVVSVTVGELQNLFEAGSEWGENATHTWLTAPRWEDCATVHERTCHGTEYVSGEPAEYDCDDVTYYCSVCGYGCSVYVQCEDGSTYAEAPRFCPACGARTVGE